MGPKVDPVASAYASWEEALEEWNDQHEVFQEQMKSVKKASKSLISHLETLRNNCMKAFRALKKASPNYEETYTDVNADKTKVMKEFTNVLQKNKSDGSGSESETESKEAKVITNNVARLDALEKLISTAESKLEKIYQDTPDPSNISISLANKAYEDIKVAESKAKEIYVELQVLVNKNEEFIPQRDLVENKWSKMSQRVAEKLAAAEEYVAKYNVSVTVMEESKVSASQVQTPASSFSTSNNKNSLERLPLPTFDGTKKNYLRFKKEFSNHVTYATDKERMMALKSKCLTKNADKNRVMNEQTLQACWERLDEEYGDIHTLVGEIFQNWANLKPPRTDQEFIKFCTTIENDVSCLRSLGHEKEMDFSYMSVTLENKLNDRMKNEFSIEWCLDESRDKERMKSLLKYLLGQKKAAHMRNCNYQKKKEEDSDPNSAKSSSAVHGGHRGRGGRGRGGGFGRGKQGGQQPEDAGDGQSGRGSGRGNGSRGGGNRGGIGRGFKRGEISKTCLICDKDHATSRCDTWRSTTATKFELFTQAFNLPKRICTYCLEPGHIAYYCTNEEEIGCPCGSNFNMYICVKTEDCKTRKNWVTRGNAVKVGSNYTSNNGAVSPNGVPMGKSLLPVQDVDTNLGIKLKTMFDNCSQTTLMSEEFARKHNFRGCPVKYTLICTDGREEPKFGRLYKLVLITKNGKLIHIQAVGIPKLSGSFAKVTVSGIEKLFDQQITDEDLERGGGDLDLLIGTDLAELHPSQVDTKGKLVLLKSMFGSGWTMFGYDEKVIDSEGDNYDVKANNVNTKDMQFMNLVSMESVGIDVPRKCNSCSKCSDCKIYSQRVTYLESLEDGIINDSIEYMPEKKRYKVSYPYNKEIYELLPNEEIAKTRNIQLEQTLMKNKADLESANKILKDSFDRGVFRFLQKEEMESYSGPVHYVPMNRVYKESESTPCRLTFDSSQPDKNGRSLNSCMGKGKNPLNYFGGVVLNWRAAEQVACGDISKMFNQCEVRDIDVNLRRFFIRPDGFGGKEDWKVAAVMVINFGETAAGSIATAVKNRTAEENSHLGPEVSKMIVKDCFMDDVNINSKYGEDIDVKIKQAEAIMAEGGFKFKEWVKSGSPGEKQIGEAVTKALGMYWDTGQDKIMYKVRINFGKKVRNRRTQDDSTKESLEKDFPKVFTKRIALKLAHSIFDPANLIQPFLLKIRLAYRDIIVEEKLENKASWDDEKSNKIRVRWLKLAQEMYELENIRFDRSVVPKGYDSKVKPMLLLFSDGSDSGQCTAVYLRWVMQDGSVVVRLVTSRVKIASIKKITTPLSELVAAQISSRLKTWLLDTLDIQMGDVIHLVDSSIVLGMIKNIALKFDSFVAPRISEIQSNVGDAEWYWLESKDNPSDLGTRGNVAPKDLDLGTMWQVGPKWLEKEKIEWPIREDFRKQELPGIKKEFQILNNFSNVSNLIYYSKLMKEHTDGHLTSHSSVYVESGSTLFDIFDIKNIKSWFRLVKMCARLLAWRRKEPLTASLLKHARQQILLNMMPMTQKMLKEKRMPGLMTITDKDGMVYVMSRVENNSYNPDKMILLSPDHPCTKLILKSFHDISHKGVASVVARSRIWYWIPQAAKLVKSIKNKCFRCKLLEAEAMKQMMAPLPNIRLRPTPVWYYTMIDLAGPVEVRGFVNQRVHRKTWMVICTCLVSRAVQCYLAEDYSTDSLLLVLVKHEARNGTPSFYYADLGSQIRGADKVLNEVEDEASKLDKDKMQDWGFNRGVQFKFGVPHFPEGQGCVERLIGEIKKELKHVTRGKTFTFGQLDSVLAECSYLVNTRPLQLTPAPGAGGEDGFICPNDLMMGRSDRAPPVGEFEPTSLTKKVKFMRDIVLQFWDRWSVSYFQRLVKFHKWRLKGRNARPGDIVLILDREAPKGKFTLGEITSVQMDEDKVVRKVMVRYKLKNKGDGVEYKPSADKFMERNVRGLGLLVTAEERLENNEEVNFLNPVENDVENNAVKGNSSVKEGKQQVVRDDNLDDEDSRNKNTGSSKSIRSLIKEADDFIQKQPNINHCNDAVLPSTSSGRKRCKPNHLKY